MNTVAVIPARGGSRGIPRKNLVLLGGHPLVAWSIAEARTSGLECVVSSDDEEILSVARSYGAWGIRRPPELSTGMLEHPDDVIIHALDEWEKTNPAVELVAFLQPTVPIRPQVQSYTLTRRCLILHATGRFDSVMTARPLHFVWHRATVDSEWISNAGRIPRQQISEGQLRYAEDGAVYVTRVSTLRATRSRVAGRLGLIHTPCWTPDIDIPHDLRVAESLLWMAGATPRAGPGS